MANKTIRGIIINADEYKEGIISKDKIVAEWIDVEIVREVLTKYARKSQVFGLVGILEELGVE